MAGEKGRATAIAALLLVQCAFVLLMVDTSQNAAASNFVYEVHGQHDLSGNVYNKIVTWPTDTQIWGWNFDMDEVDIGAIGGYGDEYLYRAFMTFDTSFIPAGSVVDHAILKMYTGGTYLNTENVTVGVWTSSYGYVDASAWNEFGAYIGPLCNTTNIGPDIAQPMTQLSLWIPGSFITKGDMTKFAFRTIPEYHEMRTPESAAVDLRWCSDGDADPILEIALSTGTASTTWTTTMTPRMGMFNGEAKYVNSNGTWPSYWPDGDPSFATVQYGTQDTIHEYLSSGSYASAEREFLSWNTGVLPDSAIVTGATLSVPIAGIRQFGPGPDPFSIEVWNASSGMSDIATNYPIWNSTDRWLGTLVENSSDYYLSGGWDWFTVNIPASEIKVTSDTWLSILNGNEINGTVPNPTTDDEFIIGVFDSYSPYYGHISWLNITYTVEPGAGQPGQGEGEEKLVKADFKFTVDGAKVSFVDLSTAPGRIYSWYWNFGDGAGTSAKQDPSYVYPASGDYTVTLYVSDVDGKTGTISKTVSVDKAGPPLLSSWVVIALIALTVGAAAAAAFTRHPIAMVAAGLSGMILLIIVLWSVLGRLV